MKSLKTGVWRSAQDVNEKRCESLTKISVELVRWKLLR